jgi:hypothetical protein
MAVMPQARKKMAYSLAEQPQIAADHAKITVAPQSLRRD